MPYRYISRIYQELNNRTILPGLFLLVVILSSCQLTHLYGGKDARGFLPEITIDLPSKGNDRYFYRAMKTRQGATVSDSEHHLNWSVKYQRQSSSVAFFDNSGSEWVRALGEFSLHDQSGNVVLQFNLRTFNVSATAQNPYAARESYRRSLKTLAENLAHRVEQRLVIYFRDSGKETPAPPHPTEEP